MTSQIVKLPTGIPGLDHITQGGLPEGRTTLVSGTSGTAKTILAVQFLSAGIRSFDDAGVFVTFEETVEDIQRNMIGFGWDIADWVEAGSWAFVDASQRPDEVVFTGQYDLSALLARIHHAVDKVKAKRVSIDSVGAIFARFDDPSRVRSELFRIVSTLKQMGVTTIITAERLHEYGDIGRFGIEEFVADNVVILRNILESEKRRRTIEILKFRGTNHYKGEYPFTIMPDRGIVAIPLSAIALQQRSSNKRIASGNKVLDEMCGGGFFRDSVVLVSGATGTGKTLMATAFMAEGIASGERCLLFAFEESRDQLFRNATGWGYDFEQLEKDGALLVIADYPEVSGLEDHLIKMQLAIQDFKPTRVAVDSLSALERIGTIKGFREFVIALTSIIKQEEVAGLYTSTTPTLLGGTSVTEAHISTITDSIILLRYVELYGEMRRGLTVLKMRGSMHMKQIREFTIDQDGMHIEKPFKNVSGILSGNFTQQLTDEIDRLENLFADDDE